MSLKHFKVSANGNVAVDGGTVKFTGTIVIDREDTPFEEESLLKALKIEDDTQIAHDGLTQQSPVKSVNLLEESVEEDSDNDKDTDTDTEDVETDADSDVVPDMPQVSSNATKGSKILFHHDSDVDDDYELSQTISGFGY